MPPLHEMSLSCPEEKKKKKRARKRRRTGSNLIPLGGKAVLCWCVEVSSSSKQHTAAIIPELHVMRHSFSGRSTTFTSRKKNNQGCQLLTCAADAERVKHGAFSPPHHPPSQTHTAYINACVGLCIDLCILQFTYTCMKRAPENTHWQTRSAAWYPGGQD